MKTCPECGKRFRPDVDRCPDDGASLVLPAPPPHATAPPPARPAPRRAAPAVDDHLLNEPAGLREGSSVRAWIGVLLASLVMLVGYGFASGKLDLEQLLAARAEADAEARAEATAAAAPPSQNAVARATKRSRRGGGRQDEGAEAAPDFVVDDREFGDVIAEGRAAEARAAMAAAAAPADEAPPFVPPKEMWDPDPGYRPSSRWVEPGSTSNAVTLDLRAGAAASAPLSPAAIEAVLDERRLMPCYDEVVQKVPQMRGRVDMSFTVAPDGHVSRAVVTRSKLRSKMVEDCIVRRARGFRFPASESGRATKFETHFDFTSR